MLDTQTIDRLAERLGSVIPPGLGQARADIEANVRDVLMRGLRGLDLVTREEFDVQATLLERMRKRLDSLEWRVAALESRNTGQE
jgi:BMFP domain-containing protein YqiC